MLQYNILRSRSIFNVIQLNAKSFPIQPIKSKNHCLCLQKSDSNLLYKNYEASSWFHTSCLSFNKKNEAPKLENEPAKEEAVPVAKRLTIVAILLSMCGVAYYFITTKEKEIKTVKREEQMTKVDIGAADYDLTDHTGKSVSKKDFTGKWLLLYFGFTHCPDICPEELEKMAEIVDDVDEDRSIPDLQPIFISVDPERDTPEAVAKYIKEFHKKFIGLTGSLDQVKQATKAFRVYFSNGPKDNDNDYIVDHTIVMYLMNPQGNFVDYYGSRSVAKEKIVSGIKKNMKNYARLHG